MKILFHVMIPAITMMCLAGVGHAGTVRTKDNPKKCGGYRGGEYHLKCKGELNTKKDQGWKNPFSGFTKGNKATRKGQGTMPHSQ